MKAVDMLKALGVVVCVAVASSAYAQSSDATATADSAASAQAAKTTAKKTDRRLGLDVRKALSKAQGFDVSNVFVKARGGAVVLTGTVPDGAQIPTGRGSCEGRAGCQVRVEQDHARHAGRRRLSSRWASSCEARRRPRACPDGFRRSCAGTRFYWAFCLAGRGDVMSSTRFFCGRLQKCHAARFLFGVESRRRSLVHHGARQRARLGAEFALASSFFAFCENAHRVARPGRYKNHDGD